MAQLIHIQGKNAEGWLGIEGMKFGNHYNWGYSKSGDEVAMSPLSWKDAFDGSCVYLKGEKGKWTIDSCGEVRGFICEFKGTLFCMLGTLKQTKKVPLIHN